MLLHYRHKSQTPTTSYHPPLLIVWLRCQHCHHGYFTDGTAAPRPCPACVGGRLVPVARWDAWEGGTMKRHSSRPTTPDPTMPADVDALQAQLRLARAQNAYLHRELA